MDRIITEKDYPVQRLWILKSIISSLIVFIIIGVFFYWSSGYENLSLWKSLSKDPELQIYFWIYIAMISFSLIIAILRRATFHYSIEPQFLTLRQGIFSRQQRYIPYEVIQNLFVKQDLFDRIFGLASLTIENASQGGTNIDNQQEQKVFGLRIGNQRRQQMEMIGFSGNKVSIPGLTKVNVEILKGIVLQKMKENPIEDSQSGL
ncbi:MAG: PH domain-containing protein [Patescibacteria group bacterium]